MLVREIILMSQCRKELRKISASGRYHVKDFNTLVGLLAMDEKLPAKYRDHALAGNWSHYRECHIKPDWLLVYKKEGDLLILVRTGSHSELFS